MKDRHERRRSIAKKVSQKVAKRSSNGFSPVLNLPENASLFKVKKEGNVRFNIIPYVAGSKNHDTQKGELDYEFTFFVHNIGEGESRKTVVCPKKTFGHKCPVCEAVEKLSRNYADNEDEIKAMKAKQRQLFNVVDTRDEEEKIQVYETPYYKGFGEMLDKALKATDEDDDEDYSDFADIPGGRSIRVNYTEEYFNGNKFFAPSRVDFVPRKEELDDEIIDRAVCLDEAVKELSYEQIQQMMAGEEPMEPFSMEEEKSSKPKPTSRRKKADEEEEDEEEIKPPKKSRKPAKVEEPEEEDEEEDEIPKGEDEDDEEPERETAYAKPEKKVKKSEPEPDDEDEEDEDEEIPVRKAKKKTVEPEDEEEEESEKPVKKAKKKSDEDDEDDEEEEKPSKKSKKKAEDDDEEKPSKKSKCGSCGKCPYGHKWGVDAWVYDECDKCELVDECDDASM